MVGCQYVVNLGIKDGWKLGLKEVMLSLLMGTIPEQIDRGLRSAGDFNQSIFLLRTSD